MSQLPRIPDVLLTIQAAVANAIDAAGITENGRVILGRPKADDLLEVLAKASESFQVSVIERYGMSRNVGRFPIGKQRRLNTLDTTLIATVANSDDAWTITFSGTVQTGLNVHTIVGQPTQDAYFQTAGGDSLDSVATKTKNAINALAIAGLNATVAGATVTIPNSAVVICNVMAAGYSVARRVGRTHTQIQVSTWVPAPVAIAADAEALRWVLRDAIVDSIGQPGAQQFLELFAGDWMKVDYDTSQPDESAQATYSLYLDRYIFEVEFDEFQVVQAYQIGVVESTLTVNDASPVTSTIGGS